MTERITPGSIRYLGAYHGPARTMYSPTLTLLSLFPPLLTLLTPSNGALGLHTEFPFLLRKAACCDADM